MARVTVEDCVERVPNRFQLVMLAAQRARELSVGSEITVDRDNDKNPVVALREIADKTIDTADLEEELIRSRTTPRKRRPSCSPWKKNSPRRPMRKCPVRAHRKARQCLKTPQRRSRKRTLSTMVTPLGTRPDRTSLSTARRAGTFPHHTFYPVTGLRRVVSDATGAGRF